MNKAFVFSAEAIVALLLIASIAAIPPQKHETNLIELLLLQKENDLLKVWAKEKTSIDEMKSDFEFVFYGKSGKAAINETEAFFGKQNCKKEISSNATYFSLNEKTVLGISVCY